MNRTFEYIIDPSCENMRAGDFLSSKGYSRHIRTYIKQHPGSLLKNKVPCLFYELLKSGDLLTVHLMEEEVSRNIPPVNLPIHIIYEDEDLMVVNKAAHMPKIGRAHV